MPTIFFRRKYASENANTYVNKYVSFSFSFRVDGDLLLLHEWP